MARKRKNNQDDYPRVDNVNKLIHEPSRLAIMAQLYVIASCDFVFLMRQTSLTQGNLSGHLNKLEEAGYVSIKKKFVDKRPKTLLSLTGKGREEFRIYVKEMKNVFDGLI